MKTEAAQVATIIRKELKQAFPAIKFSVRSKNFTGGDSVDIYWTDGPTTTQVNEITSRYQGGHFDGMIDLYIDGPKTKLPTAKFVHCHREISTAAFIATATTLSQRFLVPLPLIIETKYGTAYIAPEHDYQAPTMGNRWFSQEVNGLAYNTEF